MDSVILLDPYWIDRNLVYDRGDSQLLTKATINRAFDTEVVATRLQTLTPRGLRHNRLA